MFCLKCGEAIPDGSQICPKCGMNCKKTDGEQAIVYASQKETRTNDTSNTIESISKNIFYIWCLFALVSLIFLSLNYFSVSINLYFAGSSDKIFSGYGLLRCLKGSVGTSGYMVILLIINNITVFITGMLGAKKSNLKKSMLKRLMIIESIVYLIATIVPYFNIKSVLLEFDSDISTTSIGVGCYLNIALAIISIVYYFTSINTKLKDK